MLNGRFWPIFPSIEDKRGGPGAADAVVISEVVSLATPSVRS